MKCVAPGSLTASPEGGCSKEIGVGPWRANWCSPNRPGPRRGDVVHLITIRPAEPRRVCVGRCPCGDCHAVPGHDSGFRHPRPVGRSVGGVSHRLVAVACRVAHPVCGAGLRQGGARRRPVGACRQGTAGCLPAPCSRQIGERSCLWAAQAPVRLPSAPTGRSSARLRARDRAPPEAARPRA
jgi:hypothetical protein